MRGINEFAKWRLHIIIWQMKTKTITVKELSMTLVVVVTANATLEIVDWNRDKSSRVLQTVVMASAPDALVEMIGNDDAEEIMGLVPRFAHSSPALSGVRDWGMNEEKEGLYGETFDLMALADQLIEAKWSEPYEFLSLLS